MTPWAANSQSAIFIRASPMITKVPAYPISRLSQGRRAFTETSISPSFTPGFSDAATRGTRQRGSGIRRPSSLTAARSDWYARPPATTVSRRVSSNMPTLLQHEPGPPSSSVLARAWRSNMRRQDSPRAMVRVRDSSGAMNSCMSMLSPAAGSRASQHSQRVSEKLPVRTAKVPRPRTVAFCPCSRWTAWSSSCHAGPSTAW